MKIVLGATHTFTDEDALYVCARVTFEDGFGNEIPVGPEVITRLPDEDDPDYDMGDPPESEEM